VTALSESVSWYMVVMAVVKASPQINLTSAISRNPQLRRIVILHRDDGIFSLFKRNTSTPRKQMRFGRPRLCEYQGSSTIRALVASEIVLPFRSTILQVAFTTVGWLHRAMMTIPTIAARWKL
jgi:hypothetical protein